MGIFPAIGTCAVCGNETGGDPAAFSMEEGGEICGECAPHVATVSVPRSALLSLVKMGGARPQDIVQSAAGEQEAGSVIDLMSRYLENMMEVHLKTMKCFREKSL